MMMAHMAETLAQQAKTLLNLELSQTQIEQFEVYTRELAAWNSHTNLTAITDPQTVQIRHHLDSLTIIKAAPLRPGDHVIDVGTGAGFPGVPLAILQPEIRLTLLEATGKKVAFLDHLIKQLGLPHARTLHARAEEAGHMSHHRARYDLVVARSVARMPVLAEYMLPLAKVGGLCVAMKGSTAAQESIAAKPAFQLLGGVFRRIETVQLPQVEHLHYLVVIEKDSHTASAYPRKPGTPSQSPLS